jgi:hypothetical protein
MFATTEMSFAGISQPVCIAYSPDGIHCAGPPGALRCP